MTVCTVQAPFHVARAMSGYLAAMAYTSLLTSLLLGFALLLWAAAELRRRDAERRADALRADAVRLLVAIRGQTTEAENRLRRWHSTAPGYITLNPDVEDVRLAASAVDAARDIADTGVRLLGE